MRRHIKEFSLLTGVSVRTLHYYDEIGLLKPCFVDEQNGYRFYDETSLARMQEILFYRELDFSLKSIGEILDSPHYDKQRALVKQRQLLMLKKQRLERILTALDNAEQGEMIMSVFDNRVYEDARQQYVDEVRERWGDTAAYKEYEERDTATDPTAGLLAIFGDFAACKAAGEPAAGAAAQAVVKKLQEYITAHFYTCTDEILAGLGQMYVGDARFCANIDRYGAGTAAFAAEAIAVWGGK